MFQLGWFVFIYIFFYLNLLKNCLDIFRKEVCDDPFSEPNLRFQRFKITTDAFLCVACCNAFVDVFQRLTRVLMWIVTWIMYRQWTHRTPRLSCDSVGSQTVVWPPVTVTGDQCAQVVLCSYHHKTKVWKLNITPNKSRSMSVTFSFVLLYMFF